MTAFDLVATMLRLRTCDDLAEAARQQYKLLKINYLMRTQAEEAIVRCTQSRNKKERAYGTYIGAAIGMNLDDVIVGELRAASTAYTPLYMCAAAERGCRNALPLLEKRAAELPHPAIVATARIDYGCGLHLFAKQYETLEDPWETLSTIFYNRVDEIGVPAFMREKTRYARYGIDKRTIEHAAKDALRQRAADRTPAS